LAEQLAQVGLAALHQELAAVDPVAAQRIHPNDPQRIQRALEVYHLTGRPISDWYASQQQLAGLTPTVKIVVSPPQRQVLHDRIARRLHQMLDQGFIAEVESLYNRGDLQAELPALRAVGYRQVWQYLAGELSIQDVPEKAIIATRQLAKRQLTWLRAEPACQWFDSTRPCSAVLQQVLKSLENSPILFPK
jgi:tRNA dimethylallyltransferase